MRFAAAQKKAAEIGKPINIAVADTGGGVSHDRGGAGGAIGIPGLYVTEDPMQAIVSAASGQVDDLVRLYVSLGGGGLEER